MNKDKLIIGLIVVPVIVFTIMTMMSLEPTQTEGTPQDQAVAVDKEQFVSATKGLCKSKLDQYTDQVINPKTASAEELGKQIDQLRDKSGCFAFASNVLLNLSKPDESKK